MRGEGPCSLPRTRLAAVTATLAVAFVTHCHKSDPAGDPPSGHGGVAEPQGTPQGSAPMGSPSATVSLSGGRLPPAPPKFGGVLGENTKDSKPWWPPTVKTTQGSAQCSARHDRRRGLRYAQHLRRRHPDAHARSRRQDRTSLHSLQFDGLVFPDACGAHHGRNHHSVHTGVIAEQATGFPGYDSLIPKDSATIGQILKANGYATAWFGKDHNTPIWEATSAGPFDRWHGLASSTFAGSSAETRASGRRTSFETRRPFSCVGHPG